jgi:hypothetical protein
MTVTDTRTVIPSQRTARPSGTALQTAIYLEFLYGYGAAPGLDLGAPVEYTKVATPSGSVYRQTFERGVTIANLGDEATEVALERPYYDLSNTARTSLVLPPHSAEVLLDAAL